MYEKVVCGMYNNNARKVIFENFIFANKIIEI